MAQPAASPRYIIQLERPGERVTMTTVASLLEPLGIELDRSYGPVPINPSLGRYVVRGSASPEARAKAERLGVSFFSDAAQEPI